VFATGFERHDNQNVILENVVGASGAMAIQRVLRRPKAR
jgi:hypothetical protein